MNKLIPFFLVICLASGCFFHRKTPPAAQEVPAEVTAPVEQAVIEAAPNAQSAQDVKTVEPAPVSATASTTSATPKTTDAETPVLKTTSKAETTAPTPVKAASATAAAPAEQAAPVQNEAKILPKSVAPAPDKPIFKGEELLSVSDRLMHPYADLVPDPNAVQTAPWAYEQLKYGVYYSLVKAGTAYIRNRGLVNIDGRQAYLLQTTAFSASVIDTVFKVRDINQSWLDAQGIYSHGYSQSVREGNYKRDEWVHFDYKNNKYEGQVKKKNDPRTISGPIDIKVLDVLSALYYVRTQPLVVGQDVIFDIVNREKQYPLVVKVLKKDTVKTPAGKFKCVVVEPQLRGEGIFVSKGKSLKVWITDDEYKMPVKMQVEVFIGSVSAELLEYQRQVPANVL